MGSSNKTTNLNLSQFASNDKPGWLSDYNADMKHIDDHMGDMDAELASVGRDLAAHKANKQNPHEVTAAQVGAASGADLTATNSDLTAHKANKQNPHGVTAAQVGAASSADLAATNSGLASHKLDKTNPHGVTAAQVQTYTKAEIDALLRNKANVEAANNIALLNGPDVVQRGANTCFYTKNVLNEVTIVFSLQYKHSVSDGIVPNTLLATMPAGHLPWGGYIIPIYNNLVSGQCEAGICFMYADGRIIFQQSPSGKAYTLFACFSYLAKP